MICNCVSEIARFVAAGRPVDVIANDGKTSRRAEAACQARLCVSHFLHELDRKERCR